MFKYAKISNSNKEKTTFQCFHWLWWGSVRSILFLWFVYISLLDNDPSHIYAEFPRKLLFLRHATLVTAKGKNLIQINLKLKLVFRFNYLLESYQNYNRYQVQAVFCQWNIQKSSKLKTANQFPMKGWVSLTRKLRREKRRSLNSALKTHLLEP